MEAGAAMRPSADTRPDWSPNNSNYSTGLVSTLEPTLFRLYSKSFDLEFVSVSSPVDSCLFQVSAHYNTDPYNMLSQLKKMNLKHIKVAYGTTKQNKTNKT